MRASAVGIVVVLASVALFVGCAGKQSGSARAMATDALAYYPLHQGWGWAYEIERDGATVLAPYAVMERQAGVAVVRNADERIEYAILPDGIARRELGAVGDFMLRTPVVLGGEWPVRNGTAKVVEARKSVTLPSGTYAECVLVEETRREPDRVTRTTYCEDTGPVEIEMRMFHPGTRSFEPVVHARLLAVTRPSAE